MGEKFADRKGPVMKMYNFNRSWGENIIVQCTLAPRQINSINDHFKFQFPQVSNVLILGVTHMYSYVFNIAELFYFKSQHMNGISGNIPMTVTMVTVMHTIICASCIWYCLIMRFQMVS